MPRRKKTSTADDLIELVSMLPWWAGVVLAFVSYFLLHAWGARLATTVMATPNPAAMLTNAFVHAGQFALPVVCLLGACVSAWRRHRRTSLAEHVSAGASAQVLGDMSWREFEMLVGEGFRLRGFQVVETGGAGADGGIDLVLHKRGEKHLVQCKQWRAYKVGVQVVRELYGVMAANRAAGGFVVTSGRFTEDALAFAKGLNVELIDGDALFAMIRAVRRSGHGEPAQAVDAGTRAEPAASASASWAPACPRCAGHMVRRTTRRGARAGDSFWGCAAFPRCRGTA